MIQPLFEHRLTLAGYNTRVLELEGDGLPIVMFHGYADSADTWRQSLALLARRGQRAVAVDLPGFGTADRLSPAAILPQLDAFARAAAAYAAGTDGRPVVAVGNSLGGCMALRLAERPGEALAGVVGAAPAGLGMTRLLHLVARDPVLHSLLALPTPVPAFVLRAAVARIYRRMALAAPDAVDPRVISAFTWHHRRRGRVAQYLEIAHRLIPELHDPFALHRITVPVLLVWGDRDRLVFSSGARTLLEAVPGSRLELLAGIGHCPQVEASARFTDLLVQFEDERAATLGRAGLPLLRARTDAGR
jgi:pimeloyl-ACP methyl ester carboxylesterase